jgi:hypothetical protein
MAWSVSSGPWLCESSPIREVELIQQRLDIDAQLAQIDQAARLPELEEAFVNVAASWAKRTGISAARGGCTGPRARQGRPVTRFGPWPGTPSGRMRYEKSIPRVQPC